MKLAFALTALFSSLSATAAEQAQNLRRAEDGYYYYPTKEDCVTLDEYYIVDVNKYNEGGDYYDAFIPFYDGYAVELETENKVNIIVNSYKCPSMDDYPKTDKRSVWMKLYRKVDGDYKPMGGWDWDGPDGTKYEPEKFPICEKYAPYATFRDIFGKDEHPTDLYKDQVAMDPAKNRGYGYRDLPAGDYKLEVQAFLGNRNCKNEKYYHYTDPNGPTKIHFSIKNPKPKCKDYLLELLNDEQLFAVGQAGRIGEYCYIQDNSMNPGGNCDYYAKGRPRDIPYEVDDDGSAGNDGVVPNSDGTGTGCVLGGRNSICYMDQIDHLTQEEKDSMCTDDYKLNGGAQLRWAIKNDYCTPVGEELNCH